MKRFCTLCLLFLTACAPSDHDEFGNYNNVELTHNEMQAITQDIATFLRLSDGANTVINLEHDDSEFAHTLIEALRREGIGVSQGNPMDYLNLRYRVEKFNERQFFVSATLSDGRTLSRIWVLNNNALIPLKTRAYGVNNE